jgi:VIT1/CCC1 family predicted Fe2+/Mn2+ transporter
MKMITDPGILKTAMTLQCREITEYYVYSRLAKLCKDPGNAQILTKTAEAEKDHASFWGGITGKKLEPDNFMIFWNILLARTLGLTFALKRMEKREGTASKGYKSMEDRFPAVRAFSREEAEHEQQLLAMLDEERLRYAGSIVLGLNDALVELTGALAGFTFALGETKTISLAGLVTGISAAFSMGASEYLSCKADNNPRALKSAVYTGSAYIITVIVLILPFLLGSNKFVNLGITLALAVFIIFIFNYYLSTARDLDFKRRFLEMTIISLAVAAISFGVGWLLKNVLGIAE